MFNTHVWGGEIPQLKTGFVSIHALYFLDLRYIIPSIKYFLQLVNCEDRSLNLGFNVKGELLKVSVIFLRS